MKKSSAPSGAEFGLTQADLTHFRSPTDGPKFDAWVENLTEPLPWWAFYFVMPVSWPFILVTYIVGAIYEAFAGTDFDRYARRLREPKCPAFRQYEKAVAEYQSGGAWDTGLLNIPRPLSTPSRGRASSGPEYPEPKGWSYDDMGGDGDGGE